MIENTESEEAKVLIMPGECFSLGVETVVWQDPMRKSKKELLLDNVSELMVLADQLLLMEEYQDRLNGSNMKEALEGIQNIIEESLL